MPASKLFYCFIAKLLNSNSTNRDLIIPGSPQTISERQRATTIQQSNNHRSGFTIIELLIVISLFGLAASLVTASYLTFERNQRVKNGALALKSNLRLTQNKALSGDKSYLGGGPGEYCGTTGVLIGWYISLSTAAESNNSYVLAGSCRPDGSCQYPGPCLADQEFNPRTISLPKGVTIDRIRCGAGDFASSPAYVLFRPLTYNASFHRGVRPPFLTGSGAFAEQWCPTLSPTDVITIELKGPSSGRYDVEVKPSGEVNEKKPVG